MTRLEKINSQSVRTQMEIEAQIPAPNMEIYEQLARDWGKHVVIANWIHRGLECEVVWVHNDHFCGYVQVPSYHPDHGKGYTEVDYEVHGGLTFGGIFYDREGWWFGFDCAHWDDSTTMRPVGHRWTEEELILETNSLALQLYIPDEDEVPL